MTAVAVYDVAATVVATTVVVVAVALLLLDLPTDKLQHPQLTANSQPRTCCLLLALSLAASPKPRTIEAPQPCSAASRTPTAPLALWHI